MSIARHGSFSTDWVDSDIPRGGAEEIAALRKALDEQRDAHLKETRGLEQFAALCILTHWQAEGCGGPPDEESWPYAVHETVRRYSGFQVDHCSRCKRWAPLDEERRVCAWGCPKG